MVEKFATALGILMVQFILQVVVLATVVVNVSDKK
jgi:hypothetical protein